MVITWRYLLLSLFSFTCIIALPARTDEKQQEGEDDNRLLFETQQQTANNNQGEAALPDGQNLQGQVAQPDADAQLLQQAADQNIGRDAPQEHGEIGTKTGDEIAHGEGGGQHGEGGDQHAEVTEQKHGEIGTKTGDEIAHGDSDSHHKEAPEQEQVKHINTGALGDGFVHSLMHDGNENHEEEDETIRKGRPADIRDVSKMKFSEEELKGIDKEGLKNPFEGQPTYEDQQHGPEEPTERLHGVLMHGDTEAGKVHSHEKEKEEEPKEDVSVRLGQVGQAGKESELKHIPNVPPKILHPEQLLHGHEEGHSHEEKPKKVEEGPRGVDRILTENFMHDLMHGNSGNHQHDDADLKKTKAIRPRDLLNLGLDKEILKGLDLEKMIKQDMEDYNRYMAEKGGDEESVWNILNSFQFRYFKYGENIDHISSREPPKEEWDESVVQRHSQEQGEDSIEHMMEAVGSDKPHDIHNLKHRQKAEQAKRDP